MSLLRKITAKPWEHAGEMEGLHGGYSGGQAAGMVARWDGVAWQYLVPSEGWLAWDLEAGILRVWQDGSQSWETAISAQLPKLGIATVADDTNRLAVAAPAARFDRPSRCTLPITALRVTPPSSLAIWLADCPSAHIFFRVSTRSSVHDMMYLPFADPLF